MNDRTRKPSTSVPSDAEARGAPRIVAMRVVPVAGQDSMLLNLSGAHGPYFTRNLVILTDTAGRTGVGEMPGGERIRKTLEDAMPIRPGVRVGNGRPGSTFPDRGNTTPVGTRPGIFASC